VHLLEYSEGVCEKKIQITERFKNKIRKELHKAGMILFEIDERLGFSSKETLILLKRCSDGIRNVRNDI